jgi:hypothetical protein
MEDVSGKMEDVKDFSDTHIYPGVPGDGRCKR